MSDFIRVIAKDIKYEGRKSFMWIRSHLICKVYPVYGEKGPDGEYWLCTHDHPKAEIVGHSLFDADGTQYFCAEQEQLQSLGVPVIPEPTFGFDVWLEGKPNKLEPGV
jgi:hypothetical protein